MRMANGQLSRRKMLALVGASSALAGCTSQSGEAPTEKRSGPTETTSERSETPSDEESVADPADTIFVDPDGDDDNPGTEDEPVQTIMTGLDRVRPGEVVYLRAGDYRQRLVTIHEATEDNPITITGSQDAIIRPTSEIDDKFWNPIKIQHSHYRLTGITLSGLMDRGNPEEVESYVDRLAKVAPRPEGPEYIDDVVFAPHAVGNSKTQLINVNRAKNCEFGPFEVNGPAGVEYLYGDKESHQGEILYLGHPLQTFADGADGYFWDEYDQTRNIHVHHIDNSEGHHHCEIVDCKDGTRNITIEYCTDGGNSKNNEPWTPQSIHVRGHDCTIRWNRLLGGDGNGIEVYKPGSDDLYPEFNFTEEVVDRIATDNEIYGNEITGFQGQAIAFDEDTLGAQNYVCGNDIQGATNGEPEKECPDALPSEDTIGHMGGDSPWGERNT